MGKYEAVNRDAVMNALSVEKTERKVELELKYSGDSKKNKVLRHMWENKREGITQKDAIEKYAAYRLSALILELRENGFAIHSADEPNHDRGMHARYRLVTTEDVLDDTVVFEN